MRLVAFGDERKHRTSHSLCSADLGFASHFAKGGGDERNGGVRVDLPVRNQQGPGLA
jgi:hypothetical protein